MYRSLIMKLTSCLTGMGILIGSLSYADENQQKIEPQFSIPNIINWLGEDSVVVEGSNINITAIRTSAVGKSTVKYRTRNGSAIAGDDYTAASGTITFNAGELQAQSGPINILTDAYAEGQEKFVVVLSEPTGGMLGALITWKVFIEPSDGLPLPAPDPGNPP